MSHGCCCDPWLDHGESGSGPSWSGGVPRYAMKHGIGFLIGCTLEGGSVPCVGVIVRWSAIGELHNLILDVVL